MAYDYKVRIVRTAEDFLSLKADEHDQLVADVETKGTDPTSGTLLGVALAPLTGKFADGSDAAYIVANDWHAPRDTSFVGSTHCTIEYHYHIVSEAIHQAHLIGHNYMYDKTWLDHFFKIRTMWHADTRIMWHAGDVPTNAAGYALKTAQVDILGWPERGDAALASQVEERGGSLKNGDHYLADTEVLGYYAGLDAISTAQLYNHFKPFFDQYDQWGLLQQRMKLSELLDLNTRIGVRCDQTKLEAEIETLKTTLESSRAQFLEDVSQYVTQLETYWREKKAGSYSPKSQSHKSKFLANSDRWQRFKLSSDKNKQELFYNIMRLPVVEKVKPKKDTRTGRKIYSENGATGQSAFARAVGQSGRTDLDATLAAYTKYEHAETMLKNFASKWLAALETRISAVDTVAKTSTVGGARIHPPFNPCGTVTYRISGYAPYFLNLPFDEHALMSCFSVDPGFVGVHADLVSVEPAITAHYSQDPSLLKVFRDGLGDVYLDLALTLFPRYQEPRSRLVEVVMLWRLTEALHAEYNPHTPCTLEIKEKFKLFRKRAKVIQLAVQYTGTKYTVHASLTKEGWRGTLEEADRHVTAYWKHFHRVERMNGALRALHTKRGYLRNAVGRVVRVPRNREKDIPNRLIQSSGHDILVMWIVRIYALCAERGIEIKPVILDLHDSTSNSCPVHQIELLEQVYKDALAEVNTELRMTVPVKMEIKRFNSLAGLKGDDRMVEGDTV